MSDTQPLSHEYHVFDPERRELTVVMVHRPKRRYWLHALLFLATIFTTLCIGAHMQDTFNRNLGLFSDDLDYWPWQWALQDWHRLIMGLPFSLSLVGILTAHELGHYVYCIKRRVFATLPFFIPAPTLIGTLGAFIRIKSPIKNRADLFDIGIAGPIAGFVVAVPVMFYGLLESKLLTGDAAAAAAASATSADAAKGSMLLGFPLIFKLAHWIMAALGSHAAIAQAPVSALYIHPMAMAAWVGMLATALNLLPGGQLDGGHIIFAVNPRLHRPVSMLSILILLLLSWYYWAGWLLWAVVLRFTGGRHPDVPLLPPLDTKRRVLAFFALVMLALTLIPAPFGEQGIKKILSDYQAQHQQQQQQPAK
ncbi:MAG TPA: site-2 protease family protein [Candidatus Acidoferrales bacterium]|nr:site-2 protease family protein [Candidatus Acidoferrales bacterium]